LTCDFGDIPAEESRTITITAPTGADQCGGTIENTATITADADEDPLNNESTAEIDVICGALRILKQSTKANNPLVSQPGTQFSITGPAPSNDAFGTVTDDNDPLGSLTDASATVGEVCIEDVLPGDYTVTEEEPPAGYGNGTAVEAVANVVSGTNCTDNEPTDGQSAIFRNPPLADLLVRVDGQESGEIASSIDCTGTGPDGVAGGGDDFAQSVGIPTPEDPAVLDVDDLEPQTITCVIVIDP
jgi:hypothetical protein